MDADSTMTEEARSAVSGFAQIFKASVSKSFENAIHEYVRTGDWGNVSPDVQLILDKAGFYQMEYRSVEGLEKNADDGRATLGLRVFQKEAAEEFVLQIRFEKGQDGVWKASEIANFRDFVAFVAKARKEQFRAYLKKLIAQEDRLALHSLNPKYPDIPVSPELPLRVLGRVME